MDKARENRARRWAERLGVGLRKSRARRVRLHDHGGYQLRDLDRDEVMAGARHELDLAAVEEELRRREAALVASRRISARPAGA
jgi:hypothetical protein